MNRGVIRLIYLDNAATTFPKPEVVYDVMDEFLRNRCVNAGRGSYDLAKETMSIIDETRQLIGGLVHLKNGDGVIFTPSATIAANQILNGLDWTKIKNVFVTPFEHNAIMRTLHYLQKKHYFEITVIPFDSITFELDVSKAKILFAEKKPELVAMSHVSNATGYILPVEEITEMSKENNAITIIDCAQSLGAIDLNINNINCDFVIFAGHKSLYGPLGISGFINNSSIKLKKFLVGGTGSDSTNLEMPENTFSEYEPGSYNVYAIAGLNAAIKWINEKSIRNIYEHKKELTQKLVDGLMNLEDIEIYIPKKLENHIGVVSFNIPEYSPNDVASILNDEFNIAVRSGHHCAPFIGEFLGGRAVDGTVRVSLGYFNTEKEINKLLESIEDIMRG